MPDAPPPQPMRPSDTGGMEATRAFAAVRQPDAFSEPQGPSEFTQMFSAPAAAAKEPAAPAIAPLPVKAPNHTMLFVALGVIGVLVVLIVVFFAIRK